MAAQRAEFDVTKAWCLVEPGLAPFPGCATRLDKNKNFHPDVQVGSVVASSVVSENVRVPRCEMPQHHFRVVAVVLIVVRSFGDIVPDGRCDDGRDDGAEALARWIQRLLFLLTCPFGLSPIHYPRVSTLTVSLRPIS